MGGCSIVQLAPSWLVIVQPAGGLALASATVGLVIEVFNARRYRG